MWEWLSSLRSAFVVNIPVGLMVLLLPLLAAQHYQQQTPLTDRVWQMMRLRAMVEPLEALRAFVSIFDQHCHSSASGKMDHDQHGAALPSVIEQHHHDGHDHASGQVIRMCMCRKSTMTWRSRMASRRLGAF
jgi:hypothetical protein